MQQLTLLPMLLVVYIIKHWVDYLTVIQTNLSLLNDNNNSKNTKV